MNPTISELYEMFASLNSQPGEALCIEDDYGTEYKFTACSRLHEDGLVSNTLTIRKIH